MTRKAKSIGKRILLVALLGLAAGFAATVANAQPRQCRIEHCWDTWFGLICYYDSGWFDC